MKNTIVCNKCGYKNDKKNIYCSSCGYDLHKKSSKKTNSSRTKEILLSIITLLLYVINGLIIIFILDKSISILLRNIISIFQCISGIVLIILTFIGIKKYPNNAVFSTLIYLLLMIMVVLIVNICKSISDFLLHIINGNR